MWLSMYRSFGKSRIHARFFPSTYLWVFVCLFVCFGFCVLFCLFVCFCFLSFLAAPWRMEHRGQISEPQSQQRRRPNPLCQAGDQTCFPAASKREAGAPQRELPYLFLISNSFLVFSKGYQ